MVQATAAVVPAKAEVLTVTAAETELAPAATNAAAALPNETGANAAPTENVRSLAEAKTIGTQRATTRTRNVRLVQQPVTAMTVGDRDDKPKDRPASGRNSAQKKSRDTKGRHADKNSTKNKGKRRNPRSR